MTAYLRRGLKITRVLAEKVPFFILSIAASLTAIYTQDLGGAILTMEKYPLVPRLFDAMYSYIFYLVKMLFPYNLAPFHPYSDDTRVFSFSYTGSGMLLAVITVGSLLAYKRHKVFFAIWIYYVITLIPVIGIVKVGSFAAADRYTYLPSLGPFFLAGLGIGHTLRIVSRRQLKFLAAVVPICLSFLAAKTISQISIWRDSITLGSHEIKLYPDITIGYMIHASAYHKMGNYKEAMADHAKVIELDPNNAVSYFNRGVAYGSSWNSNDALADYSMAIKLNPKYAEAYYNRGIIYRRLGDYQRAIMEFSEAIKLKSRYLSAYYNRGESYYRIGNFQSAIRDFSKIIEHDPNNAMANYSLGVIYSKTGNLELSRMFYNKAADLGFKDKW